MIEMIYSVANVCTLGAAVANEMEMHSVLMRLPKRYWSIVAVTNGEDSSFAPFECLYNQGKEHIPTSSFVPSSARAGA